MHSPLEDSSKWNFQAAASNNSLTHSMRGMSVLSGWVGVRHGHSSVRGQCVGRGGFSIAGQGGIEPPEKWGGVEGGVQARGPLDRDR